MATTKEYRDFVLEQVTYFHHFLSGGSMSPIKDIHIKKNAWIGSGATILSGIKIGENDIVGAGSVVTHNVSDNTVVAGNSAKIIKEI